MLSIVYVKLHLSSSILLLCTNQCIVKGSLVAVQARFRVPDLLRNGGIRFSMFGTIAAENKDSAPAHSQRSRRGQSIVAKSRFVGILHICSSSNSLLTRLYQTMYAPLFYAIIANFLILLSISTTAFPAGFLPPGELVLGNCADIQCTSDADCSAVSRPEGQCGGCGAGVCGILVAENLGG